MSIHDFHSKLSSQNETHGLFGALRRLRRLDDIRNLLFTESAAGGWYPWNDGAEAPYQHAVVES